MESRVDNYSPEQGGSKGELQWGACLKDLEGTLNPQSFSSWFLPLQYCSDENDILTLAAPNKFHIEFIEYNYWKTLAPIIEKYFPANRKVQFIINRNLQPQAPKIETEAADSPVHSPSLSLKKVMTEDYYSTFNSRYTFEEFVEGPHNQFAKVAASSVSENPGRSYNPLFIYGGTGLGKTHLLQAIGNRVRVRDPYSRVMYVSVDTFMRDFIDAIKNNSKNDFSMLYRQADILLVDDVQFLRLREGTQEQFFHIFNDLLQRDKQIVITSDRPPKELEGLEERLVSRFLSGLMVDVQAPDLESRIAILQHKILTENLDIPYEVVEFVAQNINSNIRELEGALTTLLARSSLSHTDISLGLAKSVLMDIKGVKRNRIISIDTVQNVVTRYYKVSPHEIIGKGRRKEVAQARQVMMYLCRNLCDASLKTIGLRLGGRDHTTIMYGVREIGKRCREDNGFKKEIDLITQQIEFEGD
ncbi:MAG: chromosomal replication initiator protein DnaA [Candidatus Marinimicrobia bacterium]|jgi:chromosomal replication initiator protein|nr:chromosomal replication initiator protein DnaA [Candidatus Neomarinimicrobiota bacterium]MDD5710041.1 chromosomal replication initiator protein DnaA [Candidatus Neomarinimicrobiota bacterium]